MVAAPSAPSAAAAVVDTMEEASARLSPPTLELPAVAVYRKTALEHLAFRIEGLAAAMAAAAAPTRPRASRARPWDIAQDREAAAPRRARRQRRGSGAATEHLAALRLRGFPQVSDKDVASLERDFASRAADLCAFTSASSRCGGAAARAGDLRPHPRRDVPRMRPTASSASSS